jgi:protein subunit release factor B
MERGKKELLFSVSKKDFRIDTFRAGGKGGQKQNKTSSGVRVTHIESGAVGESREERSQHQNRKIAFLRCVESDTFKKWHKRKCAELLGQKARIEEAVERAMAPKNLKVEVKDEQGRWVEAPDELKPM